MKYSFALPYNEYLPVAKYMYLLELLKTIKNFVYANNRQKIVDVQFFDWRVLLNLMQASVLHLARDFGINGEDDVELTEFAISLSTFEKISYGIDLPAIWSWLNQTIELYSLKMHEVAPDVDFDKVDATLKMYDFNMSASNITDNDTWIKWWVNYYNVCLQIKDLKIDCLSFFNCSFCFFQDLVRPYVAKKDLSIFDLSNLHHAILKKYQADNLYSTNLVSETQVNYSRKLN